MEFSWVKLSNLHYWLLRHGSYCLDNRVLLDYIRREFSSIFEPTITTTLFTLVGFYVHQTITPLKKKFSLVKLHSNGKGNASFQVFGTATVVN